MYKLLARLLDERARLAKADKSFTLIELLVVVVILRVPIAIAIALYMKCRKGANDFVSQADPRSAASMLEVCNTDNGAYPLNFTLDATAGASPTATGSPCKGPKINASTGTKLIFTPSVATTAPLAAGVG